MADRLVLGDAGPMDPVLWIVRERFDCGLGVWVLIEAGSFRSVDAFDRWDFVVHVVSAWRATENHRVQLRSVACDGHVTVLRSVVVESVGGES